MTESVRGLSARRGFRGAPLPRVGAHGTFALPTGSCSQASAHVARHDGAAGRRKTARREGVVSSVDERSAPGARPRRAAPWLVRRELVAKARAGAVPKRAPRVKGSSVLRGTLRTATQTVVALRAGQTVETRTGRQHRRGRGSRARLVVPARQNHQVAEFESRSSLPFECRKADRAASEGRTTRSSSQDTDGELFRATRGERIGGRHFGSRHVVPFTGGGRNGLDPSTTTQAVLQRRKRDPKGDGMSETKS